MYTYAWNIVLEEAPETLENLSCTIVPVWENTYFLIGEGDMQTSQEVVEYISSVLWNILYYDISISSEDEIEIFSDIYEEGIYECVSFTGPEIDFWDIVNRFIGNDALMCIRQAENSKQFKNKVIRVDFMY